jgi:hypothetical protein
VSLRSHKSCHDRSFPTDRPGGNGLVSGLEPNWQYERDKLSLGCYGRYGLRALSARRAPKSVGLKPVRPHSRWLVYFIFAPDGTLKDYHHYTLNRLRALDGALAVVFASATPAPLSEALASRCDALYWKELSGYDFSAYTLALTEIAARSPGADVLIMNDSVFGPFSDLEQFMNRAEWDLTGFTATNVGGQNHIQSYAFIFRDFGPSKLHEMRRVFHPHFAFNSAHGTVACQELWMARVAARSMSVGSFWYSEDAIAHDPSLTKAIELVDAGFPFLKRSLLGKHSRFQEQKAVVARLVKLGHPIDGNLGARH